MKKSKINNYLTKGVLGASLITLSCCYSKSENPSIYEKEVLSSLKGSQQELLDKSLEYIGKARETLNNSVKDFYIDTLEQQTIKEYCDQANELVKSYNSKSLSKITTFSDTDKKYYHALKKNLEGIDFGKPQLEKIVKRDTGYNIKVQKHTSDEEVVFYFGTVIFGLLFSAYCLERDNHSKSIFM